MDVGGSRTFQAKSGSPVARRPLAVHVLADEPRQARRSTEIAEIEPRGPKQMNVLLMRSGLCFMVLAATVVTPTHAQVSPELLSAMTPRSIGPAGMSGLPAGVVRAPLRRLGSSDGAPTPNELVALRLAELTLSDILAEVDRLFSGPVDDFGTQLLEAGYSPFPVLDPLSVERRTGGG